MTNLPRRAVKQVYEDDLKDLRAAQRAWKAHLKHPEKAVPARAYLGKRAKNA